MTPRRAPRGACEKDLKKTTILDSDLFTFRTQSKHIDLLGPLWNLRGSITSTFGATQLLTGTQNVKNLIRGLGIAPPGVVDPGKVTSGP